MTLPNHNIAPGQTVDITFHSAKVLTSNDDCIFVETTCESMEIAYPASDVTISRSPSQAARVDLDAIWAITQDAAPGPWVGSCGAILGPGNTYVANAEGQANEDFIRAARTATPALIDEVKRLRTENARLRGDRALALDNLRSAVAEVERIRLEYQGMVKTAAVALMDLHDASTRAAELEVARSLSPNRVMGSVAVHPFMGS